MTTFYNTSYKLPFIILWIVIVFSYKMFSQKADLSFKQFPVGQSTPNNVQQILQDRTGYLWFATWSGLYKYDGYDFVYYKHDPDDKKSIKDNNLFSLYEDKDGFLWIGSCIGLEKYDRSTNTFLHFIPNPESTGDAELNTVLSICEDKYGILWIGTGHGLYKFDEKKEKFVRFIYKNNNPWSISDNSIQKIYLDKKGNLWIGTGAGLDKYDYKTGRFIHYWNDSRNKYKQGEISWTNSSVIWINTIFEDESGTIWLGTNGGLVEFNPEKGTFSSYRFDTNKPQNRITSICRDKVTGSLWLANWFGLYSFNRKSKEFIRYNYQGIIDVFNERSGTLWIGTNKNLMKLNRRKQPFRKYPSDDIIFGIENGSANIIWIFTYNGNLKFDIKKDQFVPYSFGKGNELFFIYPEAELLIRTEKGECFLIDSLGNKKPFVPDSLKELNNSGSWGCKTKDGYWIGTLDGGFYFFNPKTLGVQKVRDLKHHINYIYEDYLGLLWISTVRGPVYSFNPAKDTLIEFTLDNNGPSNIKNLVVNQIYEDKKKQLWFATSTGLNKLDRSTNNFIRFTEKNGLSSENIRGILEDDHGILWFNTTNGISKFDPVKNQFKNYDTSYGLEPSAEVVYGFGCKTGNGEMYFGGANGFTRFHPDSIKDNPFIPPIVITSFKKFDKPYPFFDKIELPYDENFLSFEFSALSYISPERNQYAYKMDGVDKDWIYSGARRYASYPNLAPGNYIFIVKGSNNDGIWNEAGTSILIIISPPWWKTWWAYSFYILLFAGILYTVWRFQIRQIQLKHQAEIEHVNAEKIKEIDKMKSQFFANISHEFRTPLTLILGPVKKIAADIRDSKIKDELGVVHRNANRLLQLVNQLLDLSKLESGKLKLEASKGNIASFIKGIALSYESLIESKDINLKILTEKEYIELYFDREKMTKIFSNILSNAFKFTPEEGKITISIKEVTENQKRLVEIKIRDTGIGIPQNEIPKLFDRFYQVDSSHTREYEGTGIGLALTKELVELHHGSISVESEIGKWTEFTMYLPSGSEHLKDDEIIDEAISKPEEIKSIIDEESFIISNEVKDEITEEINENSKNIILVVEDNYDMREYIKDFLSKDYIVEEAVNGDQGVRKAEKIIPDLIISDMMMPKMDGNELTRILKNDEKTSHIPIIILTAKSGQENKIEGLRTGADDYLTKPFDIKELEIRIENLIKIRKRLQEKFSKEEYISAADREKLSSIDEKFMKCVLEIIEKHLPEEDFSIEEFSEEMGMSRSQLHRKVKALTGKSPSVYLRTIRLLKAKKLIEEKRGNISEIAYTVGFSSPAYFTRCFKEEFGYPPSDLIS